MQSLKMTSGDSEMTSQFHTWKLLTGNECRRVARGYSNGWRLRRLLEAVAGCLWGPQYDRKCSFYFKCYFSVQLQQTETSDRKLCIFRCGWAGGCLDGLGMWWGEMRWRFWERLAYWGAGTPATWEAKEELEEKYAGGTCKRSKLRTEISGRLSSTISPHENEFKRC